MASLFEMKSSTGYVARLSVKSKVSVNQHQVMSTVGILNGSKSVSMKMTASLSEIPKAVKHKTGTRADPCKWLSERGFG